MIIKQLITLFLALSGLFIFSPAQANSSCGGNEQRHCCVHEQATPCDEGNGALLWEGPGEGQSCAPIIGATLTSQGTCYSLRKHPSHCGALDQDACNIGTQTALQIKSCGSGLFEYKGKCKTIMPDGYPAFCGANNQSACGIDVQLILAISSCKPQLFEYSGYCRQKDSDGFPAWCGDHGESPCTLDLFALAGIASSCKSNHFEYKGKCHQKDADGYPRYCGDAREKACGVALFPFAGISRSCKSPLEEFSGVCEPIDEDGFPSTCGDVLQPTCKNLFGINACKAGLIEHEATCYGKDDEGFPSYCGDESEPSCDPFNLATPGISVCKKPLVNESATCRVLEELFPNDCGGENQKICVPPIHFQACKTGLTAIASSSNDGLLLCRSFDSSGFPSHCGDPGERACEVFEHLPSCKPGIAYEENGQCAALDFDGYPSDCGDDGEPACPAHQQISLSILSCKKSHAEIGFPTGTCSAIGTDGFPAACGNENQKPCDFVVQADLGIKSCKGDLVELDPIFFNAQVESNVCGYCTIENGCLNAHSDFSRPSPQSHPKVEAAPGDRAIILIHGMNSDSSTFETSAKKLADVLDESVSGAFRHDVYAFDYNSSNKNGPQPMLLKKYNSTGWTNAWPTGLDLENAPKLNGENFSLQQVAARLAEAIQSISDVDNFTLVAHSMGGLVARHLVYRHYDELVNAEKRITEVVTLGSPHTGGGMGVSEFFAGAETQLGVTCIGDKFLTNTETARRAYQVCMMEQWHIGRKVADARIDNSDYPQIRWATVASSGHLLTTIPEVFGLQTRVPFLDSDKTVATVSGFGIDVDQCYPHIHPSNQSNTDLVATINLVDTHVMGQKVKSAECIGAPHSSNMDFRETPILSKNDPAKEGTQNHSVHQNYDAICFVKAFLTQGLASEFNCADINERRKAEQSTSVDTTPPTIIAPSDLVVEATGLTTLKPSLGEPIAHDNSGDVDVSNNAPALFELGETEVLWTATDPSNNSSTDTQRVIVVDTTSPVVRVKSQLFVALDVQGQANINVLEALLEEDQNGETLFKPSDYSIETSSSGETYLKAEANVWDAFPITSVTLNQSTFTRSDLGDNTVTLTMIDANNNVGEASFTVTVMESGSELPPPVRFEETKQAAGKESSPAQNTESSSGGGSLSWLWFALLGLHLMRRIKRRNDIN